MVDRNICHTLPLIGVFISHYSKFLLNPQLFALGAGLDHFAHSSKIDELLGFKIEAVERSLSENFSAYNKTDSSRPAFPDGQAWIGLGAQVLQTPYGEIFEALSFLNFYPIDHIVDLGAGYARLAYPLKALFPKSQFTGHEFVKQRVEEGKRVLELNGLDPESLLQSDILASDFKIPKASVYFIYDFGTPRDIQTLLQKFVERFEVDDFFLIIKGKATRSMIHNKFPLLFRANGAKHFENLSIYSSFYQLEDELA